MTRDIDKQSSIVLLCYGDTVARGDEALREICNDIESKETWWRHQR